MPWLMSGTPMEGTIFCAGEIGAAASTWSVVGTMDATAAFICIVLVAAMRVIAAATSTDGKTDELG